MLLLDSIGSLSLDIFLLVDADDDAVLDAELQKLIEKMVLSIPVLLQIVSLPSELLLYLKKSVSSDNASVQAFKSHDEILSIDSKLHLWIDDV